MIISVNELKLFVTTDKTDSALELMISSAEEFVKKYTNNDFVSRVTGQVEYPDTVKMGVIKMINYDLSTEKSIGVQSETISRHSVTYATTDNNNPYPNSIIGFLKPYMRARF